VATATGHAGILIVKIGSGSYSAPAGYNLAASGTDYEMWTKVSTVVPLLTVSPAGGTYYTPQTVFLSTSPGASVYYTINNTAPTTASTLYTIPLNISATTTLRAIAYNPTTQLYSDEASNTYTFTTIPTSLKVRFKAPVDWTACKIHSWVGSTNLTGGSWPGAAMTLGADGYYSYTLTGFTTLPLGIVFNNGSSSQTVDLFASKDMCWDAGAISGGKYTATEVVCLITGVKALTENNLEIYPNPGHGQLTIESKHKVQLTVYSLQGNVLLQKNIENSTEKLDISEFGKGIYMLRFDGKEGRSFRKVVVQ
jgi:alpha-amylase